jgi:Ca2+-binding RTX toxin-like protein
MNRTHFALSMIEPLEPRRHLSATLKSGVLTIIGTPNPDTITVTDWIIDPEGQEIWALYVQLNNGPGEIFRRDNIRKIRILGGDGDDHLWSSYTRIAPDRPGKIITCSIKGSAGNDDIHLNRFGPDTLPGGAGHIAHGGPGDDYIIGSPGADHLSGGVGDDSLSGLASADTLLGGPGNDALHPGDDQATDVIFGNRGGDTFHQWSLPAERKDFKPNSDVLRLFDTALT